MPLCFDSTTAGAQPVTAAAAPQQPLSATALRAAMLRAVGGVGTMGVTGGTWQRFDSTVTELQAACSADALHSFFHGESVKRICRTVDGGV